MLRIDTINDNDAEADGSIAAELLNGRNYQVDTTARSVEIMISDLNDRVREQREIISVVTTTMIPQIARETGKHSFDAAKSRFNLAFDSDQRNQFNLNGVTDITGVLSNGNYLVESHHDLRKRLLRDSFFSFGLIPDGVNSGEVEVWGKSKFNELDNLNNDIPNLESGNLFTGYTGIDFSFSQNLLLGVSTHISESQATFNYASDNEIQFRSKFN